MELKYHCAATSDEIMGKTQQWLLKALGEKLTECMVQSGNA